MNDNEYQSNDDLLADASEVAERDDWGSEDVGDLLAADKMDIEYLCSQVREETEEEEATRLWWENWKGSEAEKRYNYVDLGIKMEGYIPSEEDEAERQEVIEARKNPVKVPF